MALRQSTFDSAFGVSLIVSAIVHLAVFLLLIWSGRLFPVSMPVQETYYVDVINLPVASPRAGSPTQNGNDTEAPSLPVPEKSMALPAPRKTGVHANRQLTKKTTKKASVKTIKKTTEKQETAAESDAFARKMAKLEGKAEEQQENAALERLRRKVAASGNGKSGMSGGTGHETGSGRSGMPGGTGHEAGSRYEDYIKSRLEDALKKTSSYSTQNPVVVVRLTIGINGRISRQKTESSSGDHTFELAVMRAIEIVGETLYPPPNHKVFESGFIFKPRGITKNKP